MYEIGRQPNPNRQKKWFSENDFGTEPTLNKTSSSVEFKFNKNSLSRQHKAADEKQNGKVFLSNIETQEPFRFTRKYFLVIRMQLTQFYKKKTCDSVGKLRVSSHSFGIRFSTSSENSIFPLKKILQPLASCELFQPTMKSPKPPVDKVSNSLPARTPTFGFRQKMLKDQIEKPKANPPLSYL